VRLEVISEAFNLFGQNPTAWIVGSLPLLVLFVIFAAAWFLMGDPDPTNLAVAFSFLGSLCFFSVFFYFIYFVLLAGLIQMGVKQVRGEPIKASDALDFGGNFFRVGFAGMLVILLTSVGILLCCIPGFLVSGLLMLTLPLITDRNLGVIEAMQASWDVIKGDLWLAAALMFILWLILSVSSNLCGIGLLVGAPIFALGTALVYRDFFITPELLNQRAGYQLGGDQPFSSGP
jgi:hypothetical protein